MDNFPLQEKYVGNAVADCASLFCKFYLYTQVKSIWINS